MNFQYITPDFQEKILSAAHHIHRNPELSEQEFMTTGYILDVLESLNIELTEVQPNTGVIGLIRGGKPGPTVALRADIDALPVEEAADHAIRSERPGIMHACGHDTHTAALLGAAMALSANKEQLKGNILLIFQPAEECTTGAQAVIDTGVFEEFKPAAFLSLHVMPSIPAGKVGVRTGPIMAAQKGFDITVTGKGGHGASPHQAVDPLITAARIAETLQALPAQWANPIDPFVLTVCSIHSGTTFNIIPDTANLLGTCRFLLPEYNQAVEERIVGIANAVALAHGCTAKTAFFRRLPPVLNDPALGKAAVKAAQALYGEENLVVQDMMMGSEDFALYSQIAPVFMYHMGIGGPVGLHNCNILVPDHVITESAEVLARAAITVLEEQV
jgi:hippurate hydrolase